MSLEHEIAELTAAMKDVAASLKANTGAVQNAMYSTASQPAPQTAQTITTEVVSAAAPPATPGVDEPKKRGRKPNAEKETTPAAVANANMSAEQFATLPPDEKVKIPAFKALVELVNELLDGGEGEADVKETLAALGINRASELPPSRWAEASIAFGAALQKRENANQQPASSASFV